MKYLYSILFSALVALSCVSVAQAQSKMVITKTDGTKVTLRVADIQEVSFPSDEQLQMIMSYNSFWLKPEQWINLTAECINDEGETVETPITWRSTDEQVATVNAKGRVTAVGNGSCSIVAETDGSEGSMTINVTSETMLDIDITDIGNTSVSYSITPADPSLRYYYLLRVQSGSYSVDGMTQYGSEEQNFYHFAIDWFEFCASMYGMNWLQFMDEAGLSDGITSEYEDELATGTQYCIAAFAMNDEGELATPVEIKKFTTTSPERKEMTFEITMDEITSGSAKFTIVPSTDDPYFVNVQRASYVDWFIDNDCVETEMVQSLISNIKPSVYPEAYCRGTVTRSTDDFLSTVRSDSDYYVIVFGYDDGLISDVALMPFHTKP